MQDYLYKTLGIPTICFLIGLVQGLLIRVEYFRVLESLKELRKLFRDLLKSKV
jgi:hypothetical protein